jgi:hypothetical protein
MSRNGSGTYNLPAGNPVVTGTTITSSWANTTMQNIADGLTQSVASDGQTPMSGALNMANNKIVSVLDPTNAQDATTKNYVDTNFLLKASNLSDVANATTARGNLTAAKSGANSDITSLTGLTTPLTVAQGGTGANTLTANNVLLGNGTSAPQFVAPSTTGNVLTSNGTTWVSSTPSTVNSAQLTKAWVRFTYNGTTLTIVGNYNLGTVTRNSQGVYTFTFTSALSDANYSVVATPGLEVSNGTALIPILFWDGSTDSAPTTSAFSYQTSDAAANLYDPKYNFVSVFGS